MKLRPRIGWRSVVPLHLRGNSTINFCVFSKVKSAGFGPGNSPVYLNVYDLTPINGYVYWAGVGIFHSGVEVHGVEYAFGAHDYSTTGVFEVDPRQCPGFKFRKSIFMGTTCLDPFQVREFMEHQSANYNGDTYHLIAKNCNHFCNDICYKLTGNPIPKWVNRLARIGSLCNCMLPESLKATTVPHEPAFQGRDSEKKRLRSAFSCLSSISMPNRQVATNCILPESLKATSVPHDPAFQGRDSEKKRLRSAFSCLSSISMPNRQVSMSSLFLNSHYKGCIPPWESKRCRKRKEG